MDARTRKALEDSIAHWERMTADPKCGERPSPWECALCGIFYFEDDCGACPVKKRTGFSLCDSSPYQSATTELRNVADYHAPYTPERRAAMQAEVDFLKSLRPEGNE